MQYKTIMLMLITFKRNTNLFEENYKNIDQLKIQHAIFRLQQNRAGNTVTLIITYKAISKDS